MNKRLNDADVAEIAERVEKATPGPWEVVPYQEGKIIDYFVGFKRSPNGNWWIDDSTLLGPDNAAFIANVRADIPRLLVDRKMLTDYLAACEALLREIEAYCAPIAPGLDPVGLALYERIGPLLSEGE